MGTPPAVINADELQRDSEVNYERRKPIANNQTCTHLLNFSLKINLIFPEKLQFDFFHGKLVDPEC
ncbi:hypothetical protein ARALYDRAFT_905466 [Arabidopsis lyrata subsp. lyrata]|uniref:Uncharacterized protein n=1 Tax=Arabidopsis lyrata subsp. lyrata TaxID=81972 RepID=D7LMD6_ARALL|nr:hypothetical protein ARALYDRAFT_905466 [Arabidopsis lyrata subsp. lyrata]